VPLPWPAEWRTYKEQSCGLVNLGVSCFLNAAVQALVPVWFNTYGDNAAPATRLGQLLVHQLEHAVHGVAVSGKQCTELLRSLPAGFGWSVTSTEKVSYAMEDATECFNLLLNELKSAGCGRIKWPVVLPRAFLHSSALRLGAWTASRTSSSRPRRGLHQPRASTVPLRRPR